MKGTLKKTLALRSGLELSYAERGDRVGVPLVLLHGYTDSLRSFDRLLPELPLWIRAFAISQRGHGDSSKPDSGYELRSMARDIADFLDALALDRAVVMGHCMGGLIAQRFAIDHPSRTAGLVLVSTFPTYARIPEVAELWSSSVRTMTDPVDPAFVRAFQESTVADPVPDAFLATMIAESLKLPARVWRAALDAHRREDNTRELGAIGVPTLVLWGDEDRIAKSSHQQVLARAIAGAELIVFHRAGHALHWERPVEVARAVREHGVLGNILRTPDTTRSNLERWPA
jgi:non-heme chloroperoxidase